MPAEHAWHSRNPEELAALRVLTLGDESSSLSFRVDGLEVEERDSRDFVAVHVWAHGESEWEALYPGALESEELLSLAGLFLDAADGLCPLHDVGFTDPRWSFFTSCDARDSRLVRLDVGAPRDTTLAGAPGPVTVRVPVDELVDAAVWLVEETRRFRSDELISRSGWIPQSASERNGDVLVRMRRAYVDAQPKTVDEAFAHLSELTAKAPADSGPPPHGDGQ